MDVPEFIFASDDIDVMSDVCKQLSKDGTSFSFSPSNKGFVINIYSYTTIKSYNMLKETGKLRKIEAHSVI